MWASNVGSRGGLGGRWRFVPGFGIGVSVGTGRATGWRLVPPARKHPPPKFAVSVASTLTARLGGRGRRGLNPADALAVRRELVGQPVVILVRLPLLHPQPLDGPEFGQVLQLPADRVLGDARHLASE